MSDLPKSKRILIIDPHEITRLGYISLLKSRRANIHFEEAASFPEAQNLITLQKWDLVILELCLPGRSCLELLDQISDLHLESPVLVSSVYDEGSYGIRSIRRGVSGFISKTATANEFVKAVEMMLEGKKYLSASLIQGLMSAVHPSAQAQPHEELSDREFQVLQRLAHGVSIKHMASEMCLIRFIHTDWCNGKISNSV